MNQLWRWFSYATGVSLRKELFCAIFFIERIIHNSDGTTEEDDDGCFSQDDTLRDVIEQIEYNYQVRDLGKEIRPRHIIDDEDEYNALTNKPSDSSMTHFTKGCMLIYSCVEATNMKEMAYRNADAVWFEMELFKVRGIYDPADDLFKIQKSEYHCSKKQNYQKAEKKMV